MGPNRMSYNPDEGEYRIAIPEEFQGCLMSMSLPDSIFDIFVTASDDQTFIYGQG